MRVIAQNNIMDNLEIGELVVWNGDKSGRIDKITEIRNAFGGGFIYRTKETNPKNGEEAKIGQQFFDVDGKYIDKGVGIIRFKE